MRSSTLSALAFAKAENQLPAASSKDNFLPAQFFKARISKKILLLLAFGLISWTSVAQPSTQASNIVIIPVSNQPTQMRFDWTSGTGANKVIVIISDVTSSFSPQPNNTYSPTAGVDFGGADIGTGSGKSVCVFNNTSSIGTVTVTGLTAGDEYIVQIFEYTGSASAEQYNLLGASNNPVIYTAFTSSDTWTTPSGVSTATVQAWGGGGAGGDYQTGGKGGGGGGAYATAAISVAPGSHTVTIGAGGTAGISGSTVSTSGTDSQFDASVIAKGGNTAGNSGTGGAGGLGSACTPSVGAFNGGNGGNAFSNTGGGGGGSAFTNGNGSTGNNGDGTNGGSGGNGQGVGGSGGNNNSSSGLVGNRPGGGGGGRAGGGASWVSGNGANGLVIVSYTKPRAKFALLTPATSPTNVTPSVIFRVTFSESVSGIDITDFAVAGTASAGTSVSAVSSASGTTVDVTVIGISGSANGTIDLNLNGSGITSTATGNVLSTVATEALYTIDTQLPIDFTVGTVASVTAPVVTGYYNASNTDITVVVPIDNDASLTSAGTIQLLVDKNNEGTYVNLGSPVAISVAPGNPQTITVTQATFTTLASNPEYGNGNLLKFKAIITDAAGNPRTSTNPSLSTLTIDTSAPTIGAVVVQSSTDTPAKIGSTVVIRVTAGSSEIGLTMGAGTTVNGQSVTFGAVGGGDYDFTYLVGSGNNDWTINGGASPLATNIILSDAAGNLSTPATALTSNASLAGDAHVPTLLISAPSGAYARNASTRTYTVTYTGASAVTLAAGDITINPTLGANADVAVTGSGPYTVTLTNFTGDGTVGISIAAGTATDAAGNSAAAAGPSATIVVDNTQPTVVLSSTDTDGYVRAGQSNVTITATFTETNSGINGTPTISIPTAATPVSGATMSGGPLVWTYSWDTPTGNQGPIAVSISATDNAGNTSAAPTGQTSFMIDNTAPSAVTINQAGGQADPAYSNGINYTLVFTNGPIDPASFVGGDFITAGGTTTYSMGSPSTADNVTWTWTATVSAFDAGSSGTVIPAINTNTVVDLAGNTGASAASTTSDATVEYVSEPTTPPTSITASAITANTLTITRVGGNGNRYLLVAREGAAVNFTPTDGIDYNGNENLNFFNGTAIDGNGNKIMADAPSGTTTYNITGLSGGVNYYFAIFSFNQGSAATYNNFLTTSTLTSPNATPTTACSFPTAPVTGAHTSNLNSVTLNWTRTLDTDLSLVLVRVDDGSPITVPVNGADFSAIDNAAFGTAGTYGNAKVVMAAESHPTNLAQTVTITGLATGTTYAFAIYTYNATTFCYQPTSITGTKATTASAVAELSFAAGAGSEPATISSVGTVVTFDFTVTDASTDGANGFISQIIINQGTNNTIGNWTQALSNANVQLSDGTNSQTGTVSTGPNAITFSGINTATLGRITEGAPKTYTLTVTLNTSLGGSLPTTIDGGLQFDFMVNTASFTAGGGGSTMVGSSDVSSGLNKNVVTVAATNIKVLTQPTLSPIADVVLAQQPAFEATDVNGNRDLDYGNAITAVNTSPNLGPTYSATSFSSGVATFTDLKFSNVATSTMKVVTATIAAPNSTATSSINVTASTALASATGAYIAPDPLFNNSTNQVVLGFNLSTGGSLVNLNAITFTSSVSVTDRVKNIRLFTNGTTNDITDFSTPLASSPTLALGGTSIQFTGLSSALDNTARYFFLVVDVEGGFPDTQQIQFSLVANPGITVSKGSRTGGPISSTNYNLADNTPPVIVDIIPDSTIFNAWGFAQILGVSTPAYHTNQTSFIFTFSEPVINVDAAKIPSTLSASAPSSPALAFNINSFNPIDNTGAPASSPSRFWKLTYNITAGTGYMAPTYRNIAGVGAVQDIYGNGETTTISTVNGSSIGSDLRYVMVVAPPKSLNTPTFNASVSDPTSITLSWNHNVAGQMATAYYIRAKETGSSFQSASNPVNGTKPIDGNATDGFVGYHVTSNYLTPATTQTFQCTGLRSGVSYDFEIIPYTNVPAAAAGIDTLSIEYNPANSATTTFATTTAFASELVLNPAPVSISSLMDGLNVAVPDDALKADVMQFQIFDDGQNSVTQTYNAPGSYNFTVPAGITQITIEAWGGGGSGGSIVSNYSSAGGGSVAGGAGGAGGGGGYSKSTISVIPGNSYTVTVGNGGPGVIATPTPGNGTFGVDGGVSSFGALVVAAGGRGGLPSGFYDLNGDLFDDGIHGHGGAASAGTGQTKFSGGNGGHGSTFGYSGGAGGSSAGPLGNGLLGIASISTSSTPSTSGAAVGGGDGGGSPSYFGYGHGFAGLIPGGGGGGGAYDYPPYSTQQATGAGANGMVKVTYGGWDSDDAPFKFNQLVITQGDANDIADWRTVLGGAELYDGVSAIPVTGVIDATTGDKITFTQVSSAPGSFGYIPDATTAASSKTYTLKVWLKDNMGGLATTIDNQHLDFKLDPANLIFNTASNQISSKVLASQSDLQTGPEKIQVVADSLEFVVNFPATVGVDHIFAPQPVPVIQARDENNNVDRDYLGYTKSSPLTFTGTDNFVNGVLTLNNFQFTQPGTASVTFIDSEGLGIPNLISDANVAVGTQGTQAVLSSATRIANVTGAVTTEIASTVNTGPPAVIPAQQINFQFSVEDDFAVPAALDDGRPTRLNVIRIRRHANNGTGSGSGAENAAFDDWTQSILGARLSVGNTDVGATATIFSDSIRFSGIPNAAGNLGYINDGTSRTFTVSIWLNPNVSTTLKDFIDNEDYVLSLDNSSGTDIRLSNGGAAGYSSTLSAFATFNSLDGNNKVDVDATQINLLANIANKFYDTNFGPYAGQEAQYKARDANGNMDRDFGNAATVTSVDQNLADTKTYPIANAAGMTFNNGQLTLNTNLQILSTGNGTNGDPIQIRVVANGITNNSNIFNLNYDNKADIIRDVTFTYPNNIRYDTIQSGDINQFKGAQVERFLVRDSGPGPNDADGTPTRLSDITLSVKNHQYIKKLALYQGTTEIKEVDVTALALTPPVANITFNAFTNPFQAGDGGTAALTVKATFRGNGVVDNDSVSFRVVTVNSTGVSSRFLTNSPTGIQSALNSTKNRIEVLASQLDFLSPPNNTQVSINQPFSPVVNARDIFQNTDADFTSAITALTNNTNATMTSTPAVVTGTFNTGVYTFPANFQYTTGNNLDDVSLDITAGGISSVDRPIGPPSAFPPYTPLITLQTSYESAIVVDPTYNFTTNINYHLYPEATDLTNANSFELARALLVDGSRSGINNYTSPFGTGSLNTGTDSDTPSGNFDNDGAPTRLDSLVLRITNPANIRRIALYDSLGTEIGTEIAVNEPKTTLFKDFKFGVAVGTTMLQAKDNNENEIRIRVSFWNDSAHVTDNDLIHVSIVRALEGAGSKFYPENTPPFGYIAGVNGGLSAPVAFNNIEVTATSLDFVNTSTNPSLYAGKDEPINGSFGASPGGTTGIVHARDANQVLDTDFIDAVTVSAPAIPKLTPAAFSSGILNLVGMQYDSSGVGILTIETNSVTYGYLNSANGSFPSPTVNVIHVTADEDQTNGVELQTSLKGGTTGKRIFGLHFFPENDFKTGTEPSLSSFTIIFRDDAGNPYPYTTGATTVFKNFKLFQSQAGGPPTALASGTDYALVQTQTAALALTGAPSTTLDKLVFTLNTPAPLYTDDYSFYLDVDVDVSVNVGTPPITPFLVDNGYYNPATNDHMITSVGSAEARVKGLTRKFASTKPPVLVYTDPFNGKLNVNPGLDTIKLVFDVPVVSFDGTIDVYNRKDGTKRATFQVVPKNGRGLYVNGTPLKDLVIDTLKFVSVDPLFDFKLDTVYYVKIAKGVFSNTDVTQRKGISDEGFNLYGGIEYSGAFYFKGSSPNAPILKNSVTTKYFYTPTSASFNFEFDQAGTVHYMVVHNLGAPSTVTNAQIRGTASYTASSIIKRDSVTIDQISSNLQYATVNAKLNVGEDYYVFAYAKNDAEPIPVSTIAPYGSKVGSTYPVGGTGATLTLNRTTSNTNTINNPRFEICSNSSAKLEEPIIISERNTNWDDFSTGVTPAGIIQHFNLLLPTGFQFDITKAPVVKFSNTTDFGTLPPGTLPYRYINTTLMEISYINTGNASQDNIIINGLYVIASSNISTLPIVRFSGYGLTTVPDLTVLARIASGPANSIPFSNSYNDSQNPSFTSLYPQITKTVTYIPDNFSTSVKLIPTLPIGDYGSSFFTGSGLTNDELALGAVPLDAAFNITLTHTDQNGCNSNTIEQYSVYDHTNAIPELLAARNDTRIALAPGTPDPITNVPGAPSLTLSTSDSVSWIGLAGYKLINLFADIPIRTRGSGQLLDYDSAGWRGLVNNIPRLYNSHPDANLGQTFKTYNWEYSDLINNTSTNTAGVQYPYQPTGRFAKTVTSSGTGNGKTYFNAGSLGLIEFTGVYQSTADFSVFIPFRQEVELFIPAIPVVEVTGESFDLGTTPIFCENGVPFTITGYPLATSSDVTGYFTLTDSLTNTVIFDAPAITPSGFTDNGNGTATFNPTLLRNNYGTIRVEYTYQVNNSPAIGKGSLYIRVTPNPVANFSFASPAANRNPINVGRPIGLTSYCEDNLIRFTNTSTFTPDTDPNNLVTYLANTQASWLLGDPLSIDNAADSIISVSHTYNTHGRYDVTFSVKSQYNCPSLVLLKPVYVGAIPNQAFSMNGISTGAPVNVVDNSTVASNTAASTLLPAKWYYGIPAVVNPDPSSSTFIAATSNLYSTPDHYDLTLLSQTQITTSSLPGCERTFSRHIIIVPADTVTSVQPVYEDFESASPFVQWQTSNDSLNAVSPDWVRGAVTKSAMSEAMLPTGVENTTYAWITNPAGNYTGNEKSYLYSPAYDFTSLARAMLSFDRFNLLEVNDGVALDFSIDTFNIADPAKKWYRMGTDGDGTNWYNQLGLASKPGSQLPYGAGAVASGDYGWAQSTTDVNSDTVWLPSRHTLSPDIPATAPQSHVIFRFTLSSVNTAGNEGFALDNFRVGERTRVVLVENFTNAGKSGTAGVEEKTEADFLINNFPTAPNSPSVQDSVDYVKLNYHVGFPQQDPFNLDNPADPSGRALYYGVTATPSARMDGLTAGTFGNVPDAKLSTWGIDGYNARTLDLAKADIQFVVADTTDDGSYKVRVKVKAIQDLPATTVLHVVLAERKIPLAELDTKSSMVKTGENSFEYVVKKMLPSATGTRFNGILGQDSVTRFPQVNSFGSTITGGDTVLTWTPDKSWIYSDGDPSSKGNMIAIAFLQDEVTKEVHQVVISSKMAYPVVITGLENAFNSEDIKVYPNPADQELNILFPSPLEIDVPIMMYDQMGRLTHNTVALKGEQSKKLETGWVSSGMYIVQINLGGGKLSRRKVIISHKE